MPIISPLGANTIKREQLNFKPRTGSPGSVFNISLSEQNLYTYRIASTDIQQYQAVYISEEQAYIADLSSNPAQGIAVESKSEGEVIKILVIGVVETTLELEGTPVYLGEAGELIDELPTLSSGDFIQQIGYALQTGAIVINPNSQIIYKQ